MVGGGRPKKTYCYSHWRIVFGVNASPFLLAATINYHLENVAEYQKGIAAKLKESMYVNNSVASVNTIGELNSFIKVSKELMASAQFDLRGWKHNQPDKRDKCPVTLAPKLILQDCWREKINWDTELSDILGKKFLKWANELSYLKHTQIPRKLPELNERATLHVFVGASKSAYAASIYIRNSYKGIVNCQLLHARVKVEPIKLITIPRLEILACAIGARLAYNVKEDLNLKNVPTFFYTDSTNALYWIKKEDNWATFIANRVNEIRKLMDPEDW
ncbi:DUF1758 domain-containing protein [Trichonephila clavipes]|nr:DUF1758 domain-containing protein [Trichonephila clavipes]